MLDLLADEAAQQVLQFGQNVVELQHLRAQRLAARERQQLAHEARRAIGVLLDLHDVLEGRIGRPVVGQQQVGIADDGGQHVVEIVRHAAGELADGLHLLRLREALLQRALLGRVEREDVDVGLVGAVLGRRDEEARGGALLALQRRVDGREIGASFDGAGDRALQRLVVALGDAGEDRARAVGRAQGFGHQPREGGVGAHDDAARVDDRDRHRRLVEEAREAHFGKRAGFRTAPRRARG